MDALKILGSISLIIVILMLFGVSFGVENEGIVKYDDCRQTITIQENSWQKYLMKFTCNYIKSPTGKILGGECVHVVNDSSLLGASNTCGTAYVYQKSPEVQCSDITNGFLDINGNCQCNQGYKFNTSSNKCELLTGTTTSGNSWTVVPPQTSDATSTPPTKVGQCFKTIVSKIGTRLADSTTGQNIAGSGSEIEYTNGIHQVSYEAVQGIEDSLVGDEINLCLLSIPQNCPIGDDRGKFYSATNLRTGENWQASDSEHSCGGA
jgi:hypothetical protein